MKFNRSILFWVFIWCIFMGVTAISIGFGAVFPAMNRIARPFVCPRGEMELETHTYNPYPGSTVTTITWYCVDSETGAMAELSLFPMSIYAGVIYGVLLFGLIVLGWFVIQHPKWIAYFNTPTGQKQAEWLRYGLIGAFVIGMVWLAFAPWSTPKSTITSPPPTPKVVDAAATSMEFMFQSLHAGTPIPFNSTEKPLATWNNLPILPEATAGQALNDDIYVFNVPVDSGTITNFYHTELKSLGWELKADRYLGMEFTQGQRTLLIALSPKSDLQSWVVTLALVPK